MRILYLGISGYLGHCALKGLLESDAGDDIVLVTNHNKAGIKHRVIRFIGHILHLITPNVVFFQPFTQIIQYDIARLARQNAIPVFRCDDVKSDDFWEIYRQIEPDLVVVFWPQIIPPHVLSAPRLGCINALHTSYLPKHRGGTPHIWAIIQGDEYAGVTVYYMEDKLDTGDIILQEKVPIMEEDTGESLLIRMGEIGTRLLNKSLTLIATNRVERKPQDESQATYEPVWMPERDGLIDWRKSHREVFNLIRAASRANLRSVGLGAYSFHNGRILKIWEARDIPDANAEGKLPGKVIEVNSQGMVIACGTVAILVTKVQEKGIFKPVIRASDYARRKHCDSLG